LGSAHRGAIPLFSDALEKTNGFVVGGLPNDSVRGVSCGRRDPPKQNPALILQAEGERKKLGAAHEFGAGHDV
jgi:hypothetical protein